MRNIIIFWLLAIALLYGVEEIVPHEKILLKGVVKDIVVDQTHLHIATDMGLVQIYNYQKREFDGEIALPTITDFMGEGIPARVLSVDYCEGRHLIVSDSGVNGYTNLWIHEHNQTTQLIGTEDKKVIVKGRFIDKGHLLLGYLSNEVALYDIATQKEIYRIQLSESKFSDFALNEEKTQAVFGCESGLLTLIDTHNGAILTTLEGVNKDNTYKVDYKQGIVSAAGQDRRGAIYTVATKKGEFIEGGFLIYATGLSPSAKRVAFAMDEQNYISIYDVASHEKLFLLKGQISTLNAILFVDEKTLFSASDDNTIMMWQLQFTKKEIQ